MIRKRVAIARNIKTGEKVEVWEYSGKFVCLTHFDKPEEAIEWATRAVDPHDTHYVEVERS